MKDFDESDQAGMMAGIPWPEEFLKDMPTMEKVAEDICKNMYLIPAGNATENSLPPKITVSYEEFKNNPQSNKWNEAEDELLKGEMSQKQN